MSLQQWKMNKLIGGVEGLPWAGSWSHLWRPSMCPKPAVSLLNQHVSQEIYSCMESTHTHTDTHIHTNTRTQKHKHTHRHQQIELINTSTAKQKKKPKNKSTNWPNKTSKSPLHTPTCTNTWLAAWFTLVWKDKHQPINKSIPQRPVDLRLSLSATHTTGRVKVRQGWGQRGMKMCVGVLCVSVAGSVGWFRLIKLCAEPLTCSMTGG